MEVVARTLEWGPSLHPHHQLHYYLQVPDHDLIYRYQSGVRTFFKGTEDRGDIEVRLNSRGYRGPEWADTAPRNTFRVVVLGDSSTFGLRVDEDSTYPQVVQRLLADRVRTAAPASQARVEVLNMGIPGYTSLQGVRLWELEVEQLDPDFIIWALGFNDSFMHPDPDRLRLETLSNPVRFWLDGWARKSRLAFAAAWFLDQRGRPMHFGPRVGRGEFDQSVRQVLEQARDAGIGTAVVDLDIPNFYARRVLEAAAADHQAPFLHVRSLFEEHQEASVGTAEWPGLAPAGQGKAERRSLTIRAMTKGGQESLMTLVARPDLPGRQFDILTMNDSGENGDEVADDGVFTVTGRPTRSEPIVFAFAPHHKDIQDTVSFRYWHRIPWPVGEQGTTILTPVFRPDVSPLTGLTMAGDAIHPTIRGNRLLGEALAGKVAETPAWQAFLGSLR